MRTISLFVLSLLSFPVLIAGQQISLAPKLDVQPISMRPTDRWTVSLAAPKSEIYGGGDPIPHHFFNEMLPAYFNRTLSFEEAIPDGVGFRWIFTGPSGGLTLQIDNKHVTLIQRYYDSSGLRTDSNFKGRYPEKIVQQITAPLGASARQITLTVQQLSATISVDGKEVLKQESLLDLEHHQIAVDAPATAANTINMTMLEPAPQPAHLQVNPSVTHQSILGFGGIMDFPAFHAMPPIEQAKWFHTLRENNLLIEREYPAGVHLKQDLSNYAKLADAVPHYYGDNFPTGEISDFAYNRKIFAMGGHVLFEFWKLPGWMNKTGDISVDTGEYVRAMVGYCKQSVAMAGKAPDIVGIQNEIVQNQGTWTQMILELRAGLDRAGFRKVKIHMPDASDLKSGIQTATTLDSNPDVWKALDYSASHVYDFQDMFNNPDAYDATIQKWNSVVRTKPFLLTELTINRAKYQTMPNYQTAFAMAQLYQKALTKMDAKMLAYCWLLLDPEQPTFGTTRSLFVIDRTDLSRPRPSGPILRTFLAFSRRLPQNMTRIDMSSDDRDVQASAFTSAGGKQTMILLNRSVAPKQIAWKGFGATFTTMEVTDPYHANKVEKAPTSGQLLLLPGQIITLTNVPLRSGM
jgi:O-glycosyl hydrolase